MLFGDVGTGKSFAAGCIANALLDRDVPVLMTNFPTILARLRGAFGEDRTDFLDSLGDYDPYPLCRKELPGGQRRQHQSGGAAHCIT